MAYPIGDEDLADVKAFKSASPDQIESIIIRLKAAERERDALASELIRALKDVGAEFSLTSQGNVRKRAANRIAELQTMLAKSRHT